MVDEQDREGPYDVLIRRNSDGLVRVSRKQHWSRYWWTDGNGSCDCNRGEEFATAAGEPDPDCDCGEKEYTVVRFVFPDGTELPGDNA